MAWNEPGGSGNKDPWGNRKDEQGPPDLDEVIKKLTDKFSGLFGGRRSGGGSGGRSTGGNSIGIGLIGAVVVAIWFLSGIYIINEGKQGVVLQFGAYHEITGPGPHWFPRFVQSVDVLDVAQVRSVHIGQGSEEALMLTKDENIVDMEFQVQYHIKDAKDFLFNVRNPEISLGHVTQSAVREIVGNKEMDFIITKGRSEFASLAQDQIQLILDSYNLGVMVSSFNMLQARAPKEVLPAFEDVAAAREDRERYINEAKAYANDILPKADGQKQRIVQDALAYKERVIVSAKGEADRFEQVLREYLKAPKVTRDRIYLETMESILSHTDKVIVDVKKGSNLLYLPLDRMGQSRSGGINDNATQPQSGTTGNSGVGAAQDALDRLQSRFRTREVR